LTASLGKLGNLIPGMMIFFIGHIPGRTLQVFPIIGHNNGNTALGQRIYIQSPFPFFFQRFPVQIYQTRVVGPSFHTDFFDGLSGIGFFAQSIVV
jgi:hypothetical protein